MSKHGAILEEFKERAPNFDPTCPKDLTSLKLILIKACDVSNEVRPKQYGWTPGWPCGPDQPTVATQQNFEMPINSLPIDLYHWHLFNHGALPRLLPSL